LDFVICHELTHVKLRDGRKKLLSMLILFSALALTLFCLQPIALRFRFAVDVLVIVGPTLAYYFISRRFEYAADRGAVEVTSDPETAILALTNLYRMNNTASCGRLLELFLTHPIMERRVAAITRVTQMPAVRLDQILGRTPHHPEPRPLTRPAQPPPP
jgi:Zn-dependent protease with chaperone function